jgi:hypothetical protein
MGNRAQSTAPSATVVRHMGLTEAGEVLAPGFHLRLWTHGADDPMQVHRGDNGTVRVSLGTLIYGGATGAPALQRLATDWDGGSALPAGTLGHFVVLLGRGDLLCLFTDPASAAVVFSAEGGRRWSSSFLLLADGLRTATLNSAALYEYVLTGAVTGDQSVVDEIVRLPFGASVIVDGQAVAVHRKPPSLPATTRLSRAELLDQAVERLDGVIGAIDSAFGGRVRCALTGGYDSRLIYALLRRRDVVPGLLTYRLDETEVELVAALAAAEGVALEVIDRDAPRRPTVEEFAVLASDNFHSSDGCFSAGIFDNNFDKAQRAHRSRDGHVYLHGGGGEVFRNFFMLPAGRCRPANVVRAGFAKFDSAVCAGPFRLEAFVEHMAGKVAALAGVGGEDLDRSAVEWLYATFRCRAWFGRENTLNCQNSNTLLPFLAPEIADFAATIPIKYKDFGAFEGELITRAWPPVAGLASQYGHGFDRPPPLRRRLGDLAKILLPSVLRPPLYGLRQRRRNASLPPLLGADYVESVLPEGVQWMRSLFRQERMTDPLQISRLLTAEYLARWLGSRTRADWLEISP